MVTRTLLALISVGALLFVGCNRADIGMPPKASMKTGMQYNKTASQAGSADAFGPNRYRIKEAAPGLVFVEGGTFHMGSSEKDVEYSMDNRERQVTVHSFYMDETEVANVDWKEFLHYYEIDSGPDKTALLRPDTTVWFRELAYNEPFVELYFQNPAFDMYPVVGVSWYQANEFCKWRTGVVNRELLNRQPDAVAYPKYRLPTEAEWEYAARGLLEQELYPWEGKSLRDTEGRFMANFKRGRGDYAGRSNQGGSNLIEGLNDGYMIPAPVGQFYPNDFGLYNMAGNVAEWTFDTYRVLAFEDVEDFQAYRRRGNAFDQFQDDIDYGSKGVGTSGATLLSMLHNPYNEDRAARTFIPGPSPLDTDHDRVKVYRGGSWSDIAYYLSCGSRRFWNADSSASNIGFRCAMTRVGSPSLNY